jgi:hypothetical protein
LARRKKHQEKSSCPVGQITCINSSSRNVRKSDRTEHERWHSALPLVDCWMVGFGPRKKSLQLFQACAVGQITCISSSSPTFRISAFGGSQAFPLRVFTFKRSVRKAHRRRPVTTFLPPYFRSGVPSGLAQGNFGEKAARWRSRCSIAVFARSESAAACRKRSDRRSVGRGCTGTGGRCGWRADRIYRGPSNCAFLGYRRVAPLLTPFNANQCRNAESCGRTDAVANRKACRSGCKERTAKQSNAACAGV